MRSVNFSSGGRSSGNGCAILFLIIIFAPVLSFFFGILNFILEHIKIILFVIGGIVLYKIISKILYINEETMKCRGGCGKRVDKKLEACDDCLKKLIES